MPQQPSRRTRLKHTSDNSGELDTQILVESGNQSFLRLVCHMHLLSIGGENLTLHGAVKQPLFQPPIWAGRNPSRSSSPIIKQPYRTSGTEVARIIAKIMSPVPAIRRAASSGAMTPEV